MPPGPSSEISPRIHLEISNEISLKSPAGISSTILSGTPLEIPPGLFSGILAGISIKFHPGISSEVFAGISLREILEPPEIPTAVPSGFHTAVFFLQESFQKLLQVFFREFIQLFL